MALCLLALAAFAPGAGASSGVGQRHSAMGARLIANTKSPADGQTVSGRIQWRVRVHGARPQRLDFVLDGKVEPRTARHDTGRRQRTATIDTTRLSNGRHTLTAVAYSRSGRRSGETRVTVTVKNGAVSSDPISGTTPANGPSSVYWGAWMGSHLTGTEAPWDMNAVSRFEGMAGKPLSLVHFAVPFANCSSSPCSFYDWPTSPMDNIRRYGGVPVLSWSSQGIGQGGTSVQPDFQLADVISGRHDSYIREFATAARDWGHPFFLRFNWEMNGAWFAWGERANGNRPGEYVAAWRHVHDIFASVGATNASWVWCPNVDPSHTLQSLPSLYPGDAYVDWTGLDGYNWGTNPASPKGWKSFDNLFGSDYNLITGSIAPSKPMILAEFGSTEFGGSKAAWIEDALRKIPSYPKIRGAMYFEKYDDGMDWPIESSAGATTAFAAGIQDPAYTMNAFGNLATPVISPPS